MIRLAGILAASLALSACVGGPPGVKPNLVERPSELQALEHELEKSPHDIGLYQRLINADLQNNDFANARATAYQCVDLNPKSWQAHMLAAQVHRSLLSLKETEQALLAALRFAPGTEDQPRVALASFYAEIGDTKKALEQRKKAFESSPESDSALQFAKAARAQGEKVDARVETFLAKSESIALVEALQLAELLGGADAKLDTGLLKGIESARLGAGDAMAAFRVVSLGDDALSISNLKAFFEAALEGSEAPQTRFACLFGLWELALFRESKATIIGPSSQADAYAARLDQIDEMHPMWLYRRWQASIALNDAAAQEGCEARLAKLGVPTPKATFTIESLRLLWAIEDASRLGLVVRALKLLKTLPLEVQMSDQVLLQRAQLMREVGEKAEALALLSAAIEDSTRQESDALMLEWYLLRAQSGQAREVQQEIEAMAKKEQVLRVSIASLAWLKANIDFYRAAQDE